MNRKAFDELEFNTAKRIIFYIRNHGMLPSLDKVSQITFGDDFLYVRGAYSPGNQECSMNPIYVPIEYLLSYEDISFVIKES